MVVSVVVARVVVAVVASLSVVVVPVVVVVVVLSPVSVETCVASLSSHTTLRSVGTSL